MMEENQAPHKLSSLHLHAINYHRHSGVCAHTQELAAPRCYDKQHNSSERKGFIFIIQVTAYYLGKPGKEHKQKLKQKSEINLIHAQLAFL